MSSGKKRSSTSPAPIAKKTSVTTPENGNHEENGDPIGVQVSFQDVTAAAFRIKSGIPKTPLVLSRSLSKALNCSLYLKKEYELTTGSFKERGARNALMKIPVGDRHRGVIAASAGNHALALAYHGKLLDIQVTVVMPVIAPIMKISQCQLMGAEVILHGQTINDAKDFAMGIVAKKNNIYINGYDDPEIIAGQGTIGLEILEQLSEVDYLVIPVGGAGLIAGIAIAVKSLRPDIKIIGVEAQKCKSFTAALEAGRPVMVNSTVSLADGLAVPKVGYNAFATAQPLVDKVVCVSEKYIALAILRLVEIEKAVVEGSGAIGIAAMLEGLLPELKGKKVCTVLCGGNIDTTILGRCLERGLAADSRLVQFAVVVKDAPGGIAKLTKLLSDHGASIKDILHERAWLLEDVFAVRVRVLTETRDRDHSDTLKRALEAEYATIEYIGESKASHT